MWETVLLVVALGAAKELELGADGWILDWETGPTVDKVRPTDAVDVLVDDDILDEADSMLDPEASSGRNSDDEDDGARVAMEEPTGYGATGISASEEADGL